MVSSACNYTQLRQLRLREDAEGIDPQGHDFERGSSTQPRTDD